VIKTIEPPRRKDAKEKAEAGPLNGIKCAWTGSGGRGYKELMFGNIWKTLAIFACTLALGGCAENKPPSANGGLFRQKNEGYSILYKLMGDESEVAKIFFIKHADDSVGAPVKQIGAACQGAKDEMDEFPKKDNRLEYDVSDLPYIEQKSRDLSRSVTTKALLESSGKEFELHLIFAQAQAMSYATELCDALAADEDNPLRKSFLTDLSRQCGKFYASLMELLVVKS
jgi:hypothetical protein